MSQDSTVDVVQTALWPQGDERDPLGVWAFRSIVIGLGVEGSVKVTAIVPSDRKSAYIYTAYAATTVPVTQAVLAGSQAKIRLLTNWPDASSPAGVTGFAKARMVNIVVNGNSSSPFGGADAPMIDALDRFLLLFDPRPLVDDLEIMELELMQNILNDVYAFEGYGYYWDRSVMNAPGGPRHPGSS